MDSLLRDDREFPDCPFSLVGLIPALKLAMRFRGQVVSSERSIFRYRKFKSNIYLLVGWDLDHGYAPAKCEDQTVYLYITS